MSATLDFTTPSRRQSGHTQAILAVRGGTALTGALTAVFAPLAAQTVTA